MWKNFNRLKNSVKVKLLIRTGSSQKVTYSYNCRNVDDFYSLKMDVLDIIRMKVYLSCCPLATEQRLLLRLTDQQHFVDSHRKASSEIIPLKIDPPQILRFVQDPYSLE